jgi:HEAT repeat protein
MHMLDDPYFRAHTCAACALGAIGPEARLAVPALVRVVESRKGDTRNALWALGRIGADAQPAVPTILPLLDHPDQEVRFLAIDALGLIRPADEKVFGELARRVDPKDATLNHHLVGALAQIGPPAVPRLAELAANEHAEIRLLAIRALGEMGPAAKQAIPALVKARDDPRHAGARLAAASAPQSVGDWARLALDKIEQKGALPDPSRKAAETPAP